MYVLVNSRLQFGCLHGKGRGRWVPRGEGDDARDGFERSSPLYSIVDNGACASTKLMVPVVGSMDEFTVTGVESGSSVETLSGE